jgi:hypothetical protein
MLSTRWSLASCGTEILASSTAPDGDTDADVATCEFHYLFVHWADSLRRQSAGLHLATRRALAALARKQKKSKNVERPAPMFL